MWSMDYVQVPIEKQKKPTCDVESIDYTATESNSENKKAALVKQMSVTTSSAEVALEDSLEKSGSESSISEACDSVKETSKRFETEKDECSDNEGGDKKKLTIEQCKPIRKPSLISAKSLHELKDENRSIEDESVPTTILSKSVDDDSGKTRGMRPSKSDTSLTDSFVVIDSEYNGKTKKAGNQYNLREGDYFNNKLLYIIIVTIILLGFHWQRQLVFRSKLTMHTAYDRKDNTEPASITALAVSKDHRTLYVGEDSFYHNNFILSALKSKVVRF